MAKPVYSISVERTAGGHNMMSAAEFLAMPITDRTNLILGKKVEFLDEDGNTIPTLDAVKEITAKSAA